MPILEVNGLVKYYGRRRVVDGVKFNVDSGEVVGLLGPNGAGKTTSFRMTTGQITPQGGQVLFNGIDVTVLPMFKRARLGMGYLSQETSVFRRLTVEQNILAILEAMPVCRSLGRSLTRKERLYRTDAILEQFGLTKIRKNNAARISGGEKRRLEIARCLVCEPLLILLDEPFTGIDPKTIADIQQIVRDLCKQGIGILLTDHNVWETLKITERSYLIIDGKVRAHGTPDEIVRDPIAISEYLGKTLEGNNYGAPIPIRSGPAEPELDVQQVLEQERVHRLVEHLKADNQGIAKSELAQRGSSAIPALIDALERRDLEMRCHALQMLQQIVKQPVPFDPYAPESQRRQQILSLRESFLRKAG